MLDYSEHRKMRAKQQHVCKEMNIYEQYQPEVVFDRTERELTKVYERVIRKYQQVD